MLSALLLGATHTGAHSETGPPASEPLSRERRKDLERALKLAIREGLATPLTELVAEVKQYSSTGDRQGLWVDGVRYGCYVQVCVRHALTARRTRQLNMPQYLSGPLGFQVSQ